MCRRSPRFRCLILQLVLVLSSMAAWADEITQAQISTALGTPSGQTWALSHPPAAGWTASDAGLQLAAAPPGAVSAIETKFTGPGVASMEIQQGYGLYEISVWVDGVMSGIKGIGATAVQRVQVGSGEHTVRWQMERTASNSNPVALVLTHARWEPFAEQPLSVGVTGDGVILTSPGTRPWLGQTAWHSGDGSAAWSGLILNLQSGQVSSGTPLQATFDGPGVMTYRHRTRGDGRFTYKLDNGYLNYVFPSTELQESWIKRWVAVGPGTHVMEWWAESLPYGSARSSYEMAVDEIKLQPDVPLAIALETPGWVWTASLHSSQTPKLAGFLDPTASGGSFAALGGDTQIHTTLPGSRLLKIRSRGALLQLRFGDEWLTAATPWEYPLPRGWVDSIWVLPDGEADLRISSSSDVEIDRVELLPLPVTRDLALGLPEGSTTSGGADPWTIVPYGEINGHGLRMEATRGNASSWLELPVQGPATVDFSWKSGNYNPGFSFLVDGKRAELMRTYEPSRPVRIEIPAGFHTVRWQAVAPKFADRRPESYIAYIGGIKVTPLAPGGIALAALDLQIPWTVPLDWTSSITLSRNGETALQGPAATAASPTGYQQSRMKANFTGPGELSFWWRSEKLPADYGALDWSFQNAESGTTLLRRTPFEGWKQEKVLLPPGTSLFEWVAWGTAGQIALAALDSIEFTPATLISLGEAADAPQWDWKNDPAKPWMPLVLPDGAGDIVVSPPLESGESTRFSTGVHGPGTVSFHWHDFDDSPVIGTFSADGKVLHTSTNGPADQLVEVFIPVSSAVTLEWTATASTEWDVRNSLIGVDKVSFTAWPVYPLAAALDAPATVTWKTSSEIPFTGRTDLEAKGKTSAYVGLLPGESSWLEATVEGPGLFDFWLRKQAGIDLPGNLWNFWSLTIDGQPVAIHDTVWPALWITGAGPHRIRFTLRNPTDGISRQWLASGVDDVSWVPFKTTSLKIAGGLAAKSWKTGSTLPAVGLLDSGRDGDPAILLRPGQAAPSWVGLKLQGPCEISWDSALDETGWSTYAENFLRVDGIDVTPIRPHPWQRMRLTLPAGNHSVRWLTMPRRIPADSDPSHPQLAFAAWRLGGFAIQQGITPLARALDFSGLFALETGDTGGQLVSVGNGDAWQPGAATSLYFFDPLHAGKLVTVWGRPGIIAGDWTYQDENGTRYQLWSESGAWQSHLTSLAPGTAVRWSYSPQIWQGVPTRQPPLLKSIKFKATLAVPLANAIEAPRPLAADGWHGLIDRAAVANQTSAWSLLNDPEMTHSATLTVTGPARVCYWWKANGPSTLRLSLDGGHLPVAEPTASWAKIEFEVNAGDHLVEWNHLATPSASFSTPGEAGLDGLEIRNAAPSSLTQATVIGAGLDLTSAAPELKPWQPVAYQEANGTWTRAARAVGGSPILRTTVTGPAILEFRGRCFEGFPTSPRAGSRSSVGVIIGGGAQFLGHVLAVAVGGVEKLRIPANPSGTWQNAAVHVPTGNHEVTFRLMTLQSSLFGEGHTLATAWTLQGWVDDLQLVSPASRYQTWAKNLPLALSGQDTDADADGASNFLEYTFATAPLDPASRPPALVFGTVSQRFGGFYPELRIPYLPPHASGALESSTDLIHWQPESAPSLYFPRYSSPLSPNRSTSTYQSVAVPIVGPQKFYRLSISAIPPAQ